MSCDCCQDSSAYALPTITGKDGIYGGYSSEWKFETSVAAGATSQYMRFNNATLASVTIIYISDTDGNNSGMQAVLDSFSNSSNFGLIRVFKEYNPEVFWYGTITSVTDSGTYHTIVVTHTASAGSFAANDNVVITFAPKGDTGANGAAGPTKWQDGVILVQDTLEPYIEVTNTATYTTIGKYLYSGTGNAGTITQARANVYATSAVFGAKIRIIDVTNGSAVICEQTGITATATANIVSFTTQAVANLPASYAVFEVQIAQTTADAGNGVRASYVMFGFY